MTLRELLKQNELRVVEVAAGADGLARTISGAVMFDNPEMVNWMRAGEILLTTGYFLLDDPVKQEKVLRDLADSGSGGLVIKMKRYARLNKRYDRLRSSEFELICTYPAPDSRIAYSMGRVISSAEPPR